MRLFSFVKYLVLDKPPVKYTEDVHDIGVVEFDYYHTVIPGQEIYELDKPIVLIHDHWAIGIATITQVCHLKDFDGNLITLIDYDITHNFVDSPNGQELINLYTEDYLDYVDQQLILEKTKFEKVLGESNYGRIPQD
jgi:hypothetical protein